MLREGRHVPLAVIAAEAGVGVGTLYRSYADREALLHALEYRAYGLLNQILDEIEPPGSPRTRRGPGVPGRAPSRSATSSSCPCTAHPR